MSWVTSKYLPPHACPVFWSTLYRLKYRLDISSADALRVKDYTYQVAPQAE